MLEYINCQTHNDNEYRNLAICNSDWRQMTSRLRTFVVQSLSKCLTSLSIRILNIINL